MPASLPKFRGEGYDFYPAVLPGVDLFQIVQRCVPAAIVDIDDFDLIAAVLKGIQRRLMEGDHIFPLVIAGNHQRKLYHRKYTPKYQIVPIIAPLLPFVKKE